MCKLNGELQCTLKQHIPRMLHLTSIYFSLTRNPGRRRASKVKCIQHLGVTQAHGQPPHSGEAYTQTHALLWHLSSSLPWGEGLQWPQMADVIMGNESESGSHVIPDSALCQMKWVKAYLEIIFRGALEQEGWCFKQALRYRNKPKPSLCTLCAPQHLSVCPESRVTLTKH